MRALFHSPRSTAGTIIVAAFLVLGFVLPWFAPADPRAPRRLGGDVHAPALAV